MANTGQNYNLSDNSLGNYRLNAPGSDYASDFSRPVDPVIERITQEMIYDAAPKMYADLKLINMKDKPKRYGSDEVYWQEKPHQRAPILAESSVSVASVTYPSTQTFKIENLDNAAENMYVGYSNGKKGIITDVDTTTDEITVQPQNNDSLPAVSGGDELQYLSYLDKDGMDGFPGYFRMETVEYHNFIMRITKADRFTRTERWKLQGANAVNYLETHRKAMFNQFRQSYSNNFWNSTKGEIKAGDGTLIKTTNGVYPSLVERGAPNTTATSTTLRDAVKDMMIASESEEQGARKFMFATPENILRVSEAFKEQDRKFYTPNDMIDKIHLSEIDIGTSKVVLVPMKRFEDSASFSSDWSNRMFLLNLEAITCWQMWGDESGDTLSRQDGIPKDYEEMWVSSQLGVQVYNAEEGHAYIDFNP